MLSPASRLRSPTDFRAVVRAGRRAGTPLLVVHLAPARAGESGPPRVGFVVGRAVGSAVVRNRVRRRLRHLIRARLSMLPPASCVVVRANPAAADRPSTDLAGHLDRALARLLDNPAPTLGVPA